MFYTLNHPFLNCQLIYPVEIIHSKLNERKMQPNVMTSHIAFLIRTMENATSNHFDFIYYLAVSQSPLSHFNPLKVH